MLLNDISKQYFDIVKLLQSEHTYKTNIAYYNKHIKDTLGAKDIKDITYLDIQLFVNSLLSREYKVKTVKNILSIIKTIFKFSLKMNYVKNNPSLDIELPKFDNTRYFNFSLDLQKDFIKALIEYDEPIYCDIFFFLLHGRRKNEVLSLVFEMIDFNQKLYYIPAKINKAKRNMSYMMTDELYNRLYKYYLIACVNQNTKYPKGYIFINSNTNNRYKDLRKAWQRFLKRYNLPYIRLHDIRHLIGTYSINFLNLPIEHISYALGHTNIEITQKYITVKPEISKNVINKIFLSIKDDKKDDLSPI